MIFNVTNYWQDPPRIQRIIKSRTRTIAAHGLPAWTVKGVIVVDDVLEYCECEHCEGHGRGKQKLTVDVFVSCWREDAVSNAVRQTLSDEGYDDTDYDDNLKWLEGPVIVEVYVFGNEVMQ